MSQAPKQTPTTETTPTESLIEVQPGVWSVIVDGHSYEVRTAGNEVFVGPWRTEIARRKRAGGAGADSGQAAIVAPMPGKVVKVLVAVGDEVAAGQGVVIIEAMKMQNELKAPRAGRISSISAAAGDTVNAGTTLASIE